MRHHRVVVIGAGMGGLAAALDLARRGVEVVVLERADGPGGKMRPGMIGGARLDVGPTVLTMRWVFDQLFTDAGTSLADHVTLAPLDILARHAWSAGERLDLHADIDRSAEAIAAFAGATEADGYRRFCGQAREVYQTLEAPFIRSGRPSLRGLVLGAGLGGLADLWRIKPFSTLWRELGRSFRDPRLRQLFGRYATYCGSSPYLAPATLMLIAHVEQAGVWQVVGGMHRLAAGLADLATQNGASLRYGTMAKEVIAAGGRAASVELSTGERIEADAVLVNADASAVATGLFGGSASTGIRPVPAKRRSLSAMTVALVAQTDGFPLSHHNVFFSADYAAEFDDIARRERLPAAPTVYVCAEDRAVDAPGPAGPERLLCIVNAPPTGDRPSFGNKEIASCQTSAFSLLERCGLRIARRPEATITTTPADFERLYPATGGALYGPASHGWRASFNRPTARCRMPGLYLAGGSTHPGAGVPMAALSGRLAARSIIEDLASTSRSRGTVMRGGTSTL